MKQFLKQFMAFGMALLVFWAGNGYGVLEHSCEEHGKHHHLLSTWVHTSCEHEHHHDSESEEHEHVDSGFETSHSEDLVNFVYLEAETLLKTSVAFFAFTPVFQANLLPAFVFQTSLLSSEIHSSVSHIPLFRRTFGRSLLAFVQSFLI
ncbi:hypothetical protein [Runella sp.]|uniref:hypothetical protein n=1 Tax=Runella sp. TaxID=1960881 RepID=UPI0026028CE6|nr:hypothetical protein [Runella sp.]